MKVAFTDDDWKFIEGRYLRDPRYKDPLVRAWASDIVRRKIDLLVNFVLPRYAEMEKRHVSADEENVARSKVVADLKKMSNMIKSWENIKGASLFFAFTESEVAREIEALYEFLAVRDNSSLLEILHTNRKLQPENFDGFKFKPGTLLHVVKRYQRGAEKTELNQKEAKARRNRPIRVETRFYELFACQLAELWEDLTGEPPRINNNTGFMQAINYLYGLIGRRNRGAASLKNDLESYFLTRATKLP